MNEAANKMKQQIVEKIKASNNVLVTVSKDPSVDELSAALGFTALLNKLDKHATAIFSGTLPPAITFLEPDKVFEDNANSLRDFIIALDKEKADHLRYKIEGDLVKIFITPYRTTITQDDLEFSEGDYNIELVLALGVADQEHLDTTLSAQEQIMHDVTIMTFSAGDRTSQLGSVDWHDENASGYSEMVASLIESLTEDQPLLDKQISTALLTGIVSATDRFSNTHTSPKVMATAAQLMAAGADQQLIATKLKDEHEVNSLPTVSKDDDINIASDKNVSPESITNEPVKTKPEDEPGTLSISHDSPDSAIEEVTEQDLEPNIEVKKEEMIPEPESKSDESAKKDEPDDGSLSELSKEPLSKAKNEMADEPLLGGILSATSDQAAEDAKRELDEQQNKTILAHSYLKGSGNNPINSASKEKDEVKMVDIFSEASTPSSTLAEEISPNEGTSPPIDGLPLPPPLPDFSTLSPSSITSPSFPPINDVSQQSAGSEKLSTLPPSNPPNDNDPSQFQIPV